MSARHRAVPPTLRGHVAELSAPLTRPPRRASEFRANDRAVSPKPTPIAIREGNSSEPTRNRSRPRRFAGGGGTVKGFLRAIRYRGLPGRFVGRGVTPNKGFLAAGAGACRDSHSKTRDDQPAQHRIPRGAAQPRTAVRATTSRPVPRRRTRPLRIHHKLRRRIRRKSSRRAQPERSRQHRSQACGNPRETVKMCAGRLAGGV